MAGNIATADRAKPVVKPKKPQPTLGIGGVSKTGGALRNNQKVQVEFLLKRQLQFKQAAVLAKNQKDIALAKKYLVTAKVSQITLVKIECFFCFRCSFQ